MSEKQLKKNFTKAGYYNIRDNENGTNGLSLWSLAFKNKKKGTTYKYRIRAYSTKAAPDKYSAYSATKSVKR